MFLKMLTATISLGQTATAQIRTLRCRFLNNQLSSPSHLGVATRVPQQTGTVQHGTYSVCKVLVWSEPSLGLRAFQPGLFTGGGDSD
jgi:hypothetical protein